MDGDTLEEEGGWVGGDSIGAERSCASSFPVRPTGIAFSDDESVGSDAENCSSLVVQTGDTASCIVDPVTVVLYGVTAI